jgi:hypothetical protein
VTVAVTVLDLAPFVVAAVVLTLIRVTGGA